MGSVVATEVLQKAQPQIKPPRTINGVRLPKRLWQWSESAPKTRFENRAKIEPTEFIAARIASGWPILRPLKTLGEQDVGADCSRHHPHDSEDDKADHKAPCLGFGHGLSGIGGDGVLVNRRGGLICHGIDPLCDGMREGARAPRVKGSNPLDAAAVEWGTAARERLLSWLLTN